MALCGVPSPSAFISADGRGWVYFVLRYLVSLGEHGALPLHTSLALERPVARYTPLVPFVPFIPFVPFVPLNWLLPVVPRSWLNFPLPSSLFPLPSYAFRLSPLPSPVSRLPAFPPLPPNLIHLNFARFGGVIESDFGVAVTAVRPCVDDLVAQRRIGCAAAQIIAQIRSL